MPRHRRGWAMGGGPDCENRHSPLMASMLEPALLVLIKENPRHGYTLMTDLGILGMSTLHPSVVYRTLREMEDLGWIQSDWKVDQTQGPPRRMYHLTKRGEEVLQSWGQELGKTQEIIIQLLIRINS